MRIALLVAAVAFAPIASAREEPLWEAGLGVAGLHFPDYRGSSQARTYALPAPYFVYRGDFFKADRHGMRGVFFKTDRMDLNLSVGASLPGLRTGRSTGPEPSHTPMLVPTSRQPVTPGARQSS